MNLNCEENTVKYLQKMMFKLATKWKFLFLRKSCFCNRIPSNCQINFLLLFITLTKTWYDQYNYFFLKCTKNRIKCENFENLQFFTNFGQKWPKFGLKIKNTKCHPPMHWRVTHNGSNEHGWQLLTKNALKNVLQNFGQPTSSLFA